MVFLAQNKIRITALIISAFVIASALVIFDLADGNFIDTNIKSYMLCIGIAFGAGFVALQLMPESVKNPWLYILLHIATTIAMAMVLVFMYAIGNYAP